MAQKMSFRDPVTGVLKAWGYIAQNNPGDVAQPETESFNLAPGFAQWNGSAWVAFTPVVVQSTLQQTFAAAALASTNPTLQAAFNALAAQYAPAPIQPPPGAVLLTSSMSIL